MRIQMVPWHLLRVPVESPRRLKVVLLPVGGFGAAMINIKNGRFT
jgi:hypothetical protein